LYASAPTVPLASAIVDPDPHHGIFVGGVVIPMIVPFSTGRLQTRAAMAETD
jgi:hypothetical protein